MNSEDVFRKILTALKVHPSFLDFVQAFSQPKGGYEDDLFGGYESHVEIAPDLVEASPASFCGKFVYTALR